MSNLSQKLQRGIQCEMQNLMVKELALNPAIVKRLVSDQRKLRADIVSLQVSRNEHPTGSLGLALDKAGKCRRPFFEEPCSP